MASEGTENEQPLLPPNPMNVPTSSVETPTGTALTSNAGDVFRPARDVNNVCDDEINGGRTFSIPAVILVFLVPALGGFCFGYDIGATSYAILQLQSEDLSGVPWWGTVAVKPILQGSIVSAASAGALIGSFLIFGVADRIGRKRELQIGAVLYLVGAALQYGSSWSDLFSPYSPDSNAEESESDMGPPPSAASYIGVITLIIGRLVYGLGIGVSMHAAPTYLGEMGPSSIRGVLVSLKEAAIVLGILIGYTIGYALLGTKCGWAYSYAASAVFSTLMLTFSFLIPYSSRWLLLQNRNDEALQSMKFVFFDGHAEREFHEMVRLNDEGSGGEDGHVRNEDDRSPSSSIWDPSRRPPLVAGIGLVVLQQITGQPSVLSYAAPILSDAGLAAYSSILIACFKLFATLSAALTVEKFGRKNLLYAGCSLMLVALVILSLAFRDAPLTMLRSSDASQEGRDDQGGGSSNGGAAELAILLAMFTYIGGYQVGFGPITWLITSEIFPLGIRGQAVSLAVQMNFLFNAIVQFGVPLIVGALGLNATFAVFAVLDAYSIYFVKANVPETKGLTLEQIERQFLREDVVAGTTEENESPEQEPLLRI